MPKPQMIPPSRCRNATRLSATLMHREPLRWLMGVCVSALQTGLYYSNFKLQVGASRETGTRSNEK